MVPLDRSSLAEALAATGAVLAARGQAHDVVLIGGGALLLRGVIGRPTRDGDLLGERRPDGTIARLASLPAALAEAARQTALAYGLADDWLNLGPASLLDGPLPDGFAGRLDLFAFGGLGVWVAGRTDLVALKLWAAADRWPVADRHLEDLAALAPSWEELVSAAQWTRERDPSPGYRDLLLEVLARLGAEGARDASDR
jgi:hypothetical protein